MASDFISDIGKGKRQGVVEAIADTDIGQRLINSPLAQSTGATLKGIASGVAVPTAFAADSINTGVNMVNGALGGSANLLPTDNTKQVINWGMGGSAGAVKPPTIAVGLPTTASANPVATAAAKPAAPVGGGVDQSVPAIAGGKKSAFSGSSPVIALNGKTLGDTSAISNRVDWSPGSKNANAYIAGAAYDEQVAKAKQVNAANALPTMSPKQAAELAIANDPNRTSITRSNAARGVAAFNNQMENAKTMLGNQQAQTIAGIKEQGDKYTSDQHLAGVKYNADAHTKAAEIAGGAAVQKAQLDARVKVGEQKQKDTTALQQKVYDQIMKGYDYTGISPTAVHDYATTMAKTAGKGYVTLADPTGTHGDVIVHPGVAAFANQHLKSVKTPDQYVRLLQELDKVAAGGVHRTGIKSTQQLKPLKVSPNQIAGMTTEQG